MTPAQETSERELLALADEMVSRAALDSRATTIGINLSPKMWLTVSDILRAASRAAGDAPVAWRTYALFNGDSGDGDWIIEAEIDTEQKQSGKWQPLYAAPPLPRPNLCTGSNALGDAS